jgi:type VI secretion system protein ImpH
VSAVQIARVLSDYFKQPIHAEQFIGNWYAIPPAQQSMLGNATATLGRSALAGARVWQRDLRLRLVVGPLDTAAFCRFLPHGPAYEALRTWLKVFTGLSLEYEVKLVLRAADVRGVRLGDDDAGRVGWNAFLGDGLQDQDRRDVRYDLYLG